MRSGYMEILPKCYCCGEHYSHRSRSPHCPHNFLNALSRQLVGQVELCIRCDSIRTDDVESNICGSCADDLREDSKSGEMG